MPRDSSISDVYFLYKSRILFSVQVGLCQFPYHVKFVETEVTENIMEFTAVTAAAVSSSAASAKRCLTLVSVCR